MALQWTGNLYLIQHFLNISGRWACFSEFHLPWNSYSEAWTLGNGPVALGSLICTSCLSVHGKRWLWGILQNERPLHPRPTVNPWTLLPGASHPASSVTLLFLGTHHREGWPSGLIWKGPEPKLWPKGDFPLVWSGWGPSPLLGSSADRTRSLATLLWPGWAGQAVSSPFPSQSRDLPLGTLHPRFQLRPLFRIMWQTSLPPPAPPMSLQAKLLCLQMSVSFQPLTALPPTSGPVINAIIFVWAQHSSFW